MLLRRFASLFRFSLFSVLFAGPLSGLAAPLPPLPRDTSVLGYPVVRPLPVAGGAAGRVLLLSDSPETVRLPGLLYRDTVQGAARVLAYHVNALPGSQTARLLVEATVPGTHPAALTLGLRGSAVTPGPDPLIGQQTLLRYFSSGPPSSGPFGSGSPAYSSRQERSLAPGSRLTLYDSGPLAAGQVVSAMLDFVTSGAVQVSVYLLADGDRPGPDTPQLPPDGVHQRGTFAQADRSWSVRLPSVVGPARPAPLRIMFGDPLDLPLTGTDALTGRPQVLKGNFGVLYDLTIEGAEGRLLATSARGGPYRGAVMLEDGARRTPLLIGRGRALIDAAQPEALWRVQTAKARLWFVPANGSNLPLALIVYPGATSAGATAGAGAQPISR